MIKVHEGVAYLAAFSTPFKIFTPIGGVHVVTVVVHHDIDIGNVLFHSDIIQIYINCDYSHDVLFDAHARTPDPGITRISQCVSSSKSSGFTCKRQCIK